MKIAENTWMFGDYFLTFHGFWRQSRQPGVVFMFIENGETIKLRIHFAHINSVIGDDWMKRDSLTEWEKEHLLISRNALKADNNTVEVNI